VEERELDEAPWKISDVQIGQFYLHLEKLRDSNNFLKKNLVEKTYNRYMVGLDHTEGEFLSLVVNPPFLTEKTIMNMNYSRDGGYTFDLETNQILYGTYFFLW
jgi:hypothetical protein